MGLITEFTFGKWSNDVERRAQHLKKQNPLNPLIGQNYREDAYRFMIRFNSWAYIHCVSSAMKACGNVKERLTPNEIITLNGLVQLSENQLDHSEEVLAKLMKDESDQPSL